LDRTNQKSDAVSEKTEDATVAKANPIEHLKNIDAACDDARLSNLEKSAGSRRRLKRRKGV
jgi:hypothetical protein